MPVLHLKLDLVRFVWVIVIILSLIVALKTLFLLLNLIVAFTKLLKFSCFKFLAYNLENRSQGVVRLNRCQKCDFKWMSPSPPSPGIAWIIESQTTKMAEELMLLFKIMFLVVVWKLSIKHWIPKHMSNWNFIDYWHICQHTHRSGERNLGSKVLSFFVIVKSLGKICLLSYWHNSWNIYNRMKFTSGLRK